MLFLNKNPHFKKKYQKLLLPVLFKSYFRSIIKKLEITYVIFFMGINQKLTTGFEAVVSENSFKEIINYIEDVYKKI